jgi:hypothetical protein
MSVEYKAILCYGIELTHEKELTYIEKVGEKRWEEIKDNWFIAADEWTGTPSYGILGIEIACAGDGEYIPLGNGQILLQNIPKDISNSFREEMFEIKEFNILPQLYMICQVA